MGANHSAMEHLGRLWNLPEVREARNHRDIREAMLKGYRHILRGHLNNGTASWGKTYEVLRRMETNRIRDALMGGIEEVRLRWMVAEDPVCRRLPMEYEGEHGHAPNLPYGPGQAILKNEAKGHFDMQQYDKGMQCIDRMLNVNPDLIFDPGTVGVAMNGAHKCRRAPPALVLAEHSLQLQAESRTALGIAVCAAYDLGFYVKTQQYGTKLLEEKREEMTLYKVARAAHELGHWDQLAALLAEALEGEVHRNFLRGYRNMAATLAVRAPHMIDRALLENMRKLGIPDLIEKIKFYQKGMPKEHNGAPNGTDRLIAALYTIVGERQRAQAVRQRARGR